MRQSNFLNRVLGGVRLPVMAGAIVMASIVVTSGAVRAENDDWARAVIDEMKSAERAVSPRAERVRVASLGGGEYSPPVRAQRRQREVEVPEATAEPKAKPKRVASLGTSKSDSGSSDRPQRKSLSGGSVNWIASAGCLTGSLRSIINTVASNYGPVTVNSTCRSKSHNARVGGAPKSYHLDGDAVDFRIHSNASAAYAYLRGNGNVGGLKHYGGGLFHIDTGPRRSW